MLCANAAVANMITADATMNVFKFQPPTSLGDNVDEMGVFRNHRDLVFCIL
jgi:hypothetical protein